MTERSQPEPAHALWLTDGDGTTLGRVAYEAHERALAETALGHSAPHFQASWTGQSLDARGWWQHAAHAVARAALRLGAEAARVQLEGVNRARLSCELPPLALPDPFPELRPTVVELYLAAQEKARARAADSLRTLRGASPLDTLPPTVPEHQHYWQDAGWARDMTGILVLYCAPCGEVRFVDAQRKRITQTQPIPAETAGAAETAPLSPAALEASLAYLRSAPATAEATPEDERLIYRVEAPPPPRPSLDEWIGGPPPGRPQPGPR